MTDRGQYVQLVGGVTWDPETKPTRSGDVLKFGLVVKRGYDNEADFVTVTVFNEGLRNRAKSEVHKGAASVAVEGWMKKDSYNGKERLEIVADRLGVTEWFPATRKNQSAPAQVETSDEYANV